MDEDVTCRNCGSPRSTHCECHRSCPGQCPPEGETDRVYRTFDGGPCPACRGERWVCEAHPDRPWDGDTEADCRCGAPGMPCLKCNTGMPPVAPPGSVEVWRMPGTKAMPES